MAIGTAHPPNLIEQHDFADFYFRVSNCEREVELKNKFERICRKTMINKRYFHHNEKLLDKYPNICAFSELSLNDRQDICVPEVPKLGRQEALKALEEWGQYKSLVTHLVMCTSSGVDMPSADLRLAKLLDLRPDVNRYMVYMQGCYAGGTVLRYAKDLAENNKSARVLVVCAELTLSCFRGPNESHVDTGIGISLFGDGAVALIVGSYPKKGIEKPIFEIVFAQQRIIPDSEDVIRLCFREEGLTFHLAKDSPKIVAKYIEQCLADAFEPVGSLSDWNSLFWIPHPGGWAILDAVQAKLNLHPGKFRAARHVLWDYGNMISAAVLFIMDEMRRKSMVDGLPTTGEGLEWGVLLGFGPGMTVETIVLRSVPI